jgi:hypothetical protein
VTVAERSSHPSTNGFSARQTTEEGGRLDGAEAARPRASRAEASRSAGGAVKAEERASVDMVNRKGVSGNDATGRRGRANANSERLD